MQNINVTILQADLKWEDAPANLEALGNIIARIEEQTDLIVLPEMFCTGFSMEPERIAETMDSASVQWMQKVAGTTNAVVCGSMAIQDGTQFYNRFLWVKPDGSLEHYDKKHLFTYAGEDKYYQAGHSKRIVEHKGWKFLPMICYDLRFPVWSRNRYHADTGFEYDCLVYVANWPQARNHAWRILLMARAIENQAYVIGVNRVGVDGNQISYSGDSAILDPKGENLSALMPSCEGIETVQLSRCHLDSFREKFRQGPDWEKFTLL